MPSSYLYRLTLDHCRITVPQLATAFRIDADTLLTAAHPLVDASAFTLTTADGEPVGVSVVVLAPERDLAVLRLDDPVAPDGALPLAGAEVQPDDPVILPTFDSDRLLEEQSALAVRRAEVTVDGENPRRSIELEADIVSGDSGAPVVFEGRAVGVVFASTRGSDRGWAVSLPEMIEVLARDDGSPVALSCG